LEKEVAMSGSGNSGYGGGFHSQGASCEKLVIDTQLSSPVAAVVVQLVIGSVLLVGTQSGQITTLVVASYNGQVAGGLAAAQIARLLECLGDGHQYKATVTSINGAQIKVRVEAA
jgi:hypothetical protein